MTLVDLLCASYIALALPNADMACENMHTVVEAAEEHNVKPSVMVALIHVESRWTARAISRSNACGLTQVLPKFSAGYRNRFGKKLTCQQLLDPTTSIKRGTKILGFFLKRYDRNYRRSLCAYNAGGSRCRPGLKKNKGHRYAAKVLRLARKLQLRMNVEEKAYQEEEYVPGCYE